MKPIYVILISLGTGIIGFIAGGGLGFAGGATTGGFVGGAGGMCLVIDTATKQGMLTPAQAEKLGTEIGKNIKLDGEAKLVKEFSVEGSTESCKRLFKGIAEVEK